MLLFGVSASLAISISPHQLGEMIASDGDAHGKFVHRGCGAWLRDAQDHIERRVERLLLR